MRKVSAKSRWRVCIAGYMAAAKLMRAIRVAEFGGPSVLKLYSDVAVPSPGQKEVTYIHVK